MTEYTIWVGGDHPWSRSYLGEIGAERLTEEQVAKYFTFDEDGEIEFDQDLIAEKVDCWEPDQTDLPTWDTITDGCLGWGAYTDQMVGVCRSDDEETPLLLKDVDEVPTEEEEELDYPEGVWMLYNSCEKGGYSGTFELPDGEEFDENKLVLHTRLINGGFNIVVGATYDGQDIEMSGDTDGKGIDWYIIHKDQCVMFK